MSARRNGRLACAALKVAERGKEEMRTGRGDFFPFPVTDAPLSPLSSLNSNSSSPFPGPSRPSNHEIHSRLHRLRGPGLVVGAFDGIERERKRGRPPAESELYFFRFRFAHFDLLFVECLPDSFVSLFRRRGRATYLRLGNLKNKRKNEWRKRRRPLFFSSSFDETIQKKTRVERRFISPLTSFFSAPPPRTEKPTGPRPARPLQQDRAQGYDRAAVSLFCLFFLQGKSSLLPLVLSLSVLLSTSTTTRAL